MKIILVLFLCILAACVGTIPSEEEDASVNACVTPSARYLATYEAVFPEQCPPVPAVVVSVPVRGTMLEGDTCTYFSDLGCATYAKCGTDRESVMGWALDGSEARGWLRLGVCEYQVTYLRVQ